MVQTAPEHSLIPGVTRSGLLLGLGAGAAAACAGVSVSAMSGHDRSKHGARLPEVLDASSNCLDTFRRLIRLPDIPAQGRFR
jgi:hypothetical protein